VKRTCLLLCGLCLVSASEASDTGSGTWSNLWRTPDQRGELLLRQGDAAGAARTYSDPRRKAYAELLAGDNAAAARDLAAFDDGDAQYNRGNALAQSGELQQALQAYDQALARDPHNQDARHNRDLVAQALKQQSPQQQAQDSRQPSSTQPQQQQQQQQSSSGGSPERNDQTQTAPQSQQQPQSASQSASQPQSSSQQSASPSQDRNATSDSGQQTPPRDGSSGGQQPQQASSPPQTAQNRRADAAATQLDDTAQARRDAANGLQQAAQQPAGQVAQPGAKPSGTVQAEASAPSKTPAAEQQLAQEQWLRQVPDDPSGLLRRKFMIEHMLRQRNPQGQQP
jgi:Ca-activated chloride channel family protein